MNFSDFKLVPIPVQAHIIYQKGIQLGEREEAGNLIVLYQVYSFYVEVYYRLQDNEIIKFRSFHSTHLLEPYFKQISLDCMFDYPLNYLAPAQS